MVDLTDLSSDDEVNAQQLPLPPPFAAFSRRCLRGFLCLSVADETDATAAFRQLSPPFTAVLLSRSQGVGVPTRHRTAFRAALQTPAPRRLREG